MLRKKITSKIKKINMNDFTEKTLEEIIFENRDKVSERGFPFFLKNSIRQFILPSGLKVDLFSFEINEDSICCRVFELKKENLDTDSLCQLLRYCTEIYSLLIPHFTNISIDKFLIGKKVCDDLSLLHLHLVDVELYTYTYNFDGVFFHKHITMLEVSIEQLKKTFMPNDKSINFAERLTTLKNPTHN